MKKMTQRRLQVGGFRQGDRVRIPNSVTASAPNGLTGMVNEPNGRYPNRVAVGFYLDREYREVCYHPSELEPADGADGQGQ